MDHKDNGETLRQGRNVSSIDVKPKPYYKSILILPTMNTKVDFYNVASKYLHIIFGIPLQRIATYLIAISSEEELAEEAAEVLDADDSKFRCKHYKRKCQFVVSLVPGPVPGQVVTRC